LHRRRCGQEPLGLPNRAFWSCWGSVPSSAPRSQFAGAASEKIFGGALSRNRRSERGGEMNATSVAGLLILSLAPVAAFAGPGIPLPEPGVLGLLAIAAIAG